MIRNLWPILCGSLLLGACSAESEEKLGLWVGDMKLCADNVRSVVERPGQATPTPIVLIRMTDEGARELEQSSRAYVGKPLPFVVNGRVIFAPNLFEPLSEGKIQLSELAPGDLSDVIAYAKRPC
jgi:preprotein translocase subunit SecD